uniref:Transcription factor LHW-like isoform X1 n=1 Tax=Cymbidium ensifolium TaxID=78740 RepID=A0A515HG58_CYMEN|nr:transcription factor LHW-like isoform X1 [Cymbidium ensifolium]
MGFEPGESLRRFCVEIGWSYAVFWRAVGYPSPKYLVWGDGHWFGKLQLSLSDDVNSHVNSSSEFQSLGVGSIDELVNKTMVPQVHVIGVGIVGQAACTGNHRWILRNVTGDNETTLKYFPDVNNQFLAGIQTIVIIPVFPHGVVQFGSTKRVMENLLFVNHARTSLMQLALEPVSSIHGLTQSAFGPNSTPSRCISPAISDYLFRDNCSNVDRSLSRRCNHQLAISSATRSLSNCSSSLSTQVKEKMSKFDVEGLPNKENVGTASPPFAELHQPMIHQAGNILFRLNKQLEDGLVDAQLTSDEDLMSLSRMPVTSGSLSFMAHNLLPACGSITQEPAISIKASVDGMFGDFDTESLLQKIEPMDCAKDMERLTSACTSEIVSTHGNVSCSNHLGMIRDTNSLNGNHPISVNSSTNKLSKKTQGVSIPGYLKQGNGLHSSGISSSSCGLPLLIGLQECRFGSSSIFEARQEIKSADCNGDDSCKAEKLQKVCAENDSSFISIQNEKSSSFSQLATSGDDLFDVLGLYDSLDGVKASRQQLTADVSACSSQLNLSPILYSVEDAISCTDVFSESNSDQLLDAVVSSVYQGARRSLDETLSLKASVKNVIGSSIPCPSLSNGGSASSGQKQGDYMFSSMVKGNAEATGSISHRTADRIEETETPEYNKSQTSLWVESGKNMNGDNFFTSHGKRVDEMSKLNRKRARPGETPRPRPKDRQLIMDRVKELREIVPNGAKCSIDTLLEKTIKHMLFLQSVSKHADKLKKTGEPKIISKDGAVVLKDNFRGGAAWAFEVGSRSLTCPIIVEDLNPPREMLVEMLCEERGLFLEIADLIRGLGLTILKGVMEARRDKIWARFAVEANRDVTRMEIFLSLVHLLEPTIGSGIIPQSVHNSKTQKNIQPALCSCNWGCI